MREAVAKGRQQPARTLSIPAPIAGWVTAASWIHDAKTPGVPAAPSTARVLENWLPTTTGVRMRGGSRLMQTLNLLLTDDDEETQLTDDDGETDLTEDGDIAADGGIVAMFSYASGANERLFAATGSTIVDVSAFETGEAAIGKVTSLTSGYWVAQQIGTAGGEFLVVVNGEDAPRYFDGTTWTEILAVSTPGKVSITGVDPSTLSHVTLYRSRLFFVESDTMNLWFLPVDSIGGAAQAVSLAGVMQNGGSLLLAATWSLDAGDGIDDKLVVISKGGEVAVYEGADPTSASGWSLVGVYEISEPLGRYATMQAGGDLLIATVDGLVALSEVINKDPAALSLSAVTRPIEDEWRTRAADRDNRDWQIAKWSALGVAFITLPHTGDELLAVNLRTGAWSLITSWNAQAIGVWRERGFYGDGDGRIVEMDVGGEDYGGMPYTARLSGAFRTLGDPARHKEARLARGVFRASTEFAAKLSVAVDYVDALPGAPDAAAGAALADGMQMVTTRWRSVAGRGVALAPQVQIRSDSATKPDVELIQIDLVYESGGAVV